MGKKYPRISFKKRLKKLDSEMDEVANLTIENFSDSISLIENYNEEIHEKITLNSEIIQKKVFKIEKLCISFLATEQPVAKDLRLIETTIKLASHYKRIGNLSAKIAESVFIIRDEKIDEEIRDNIVEMANGAEAMLTVAMNGFSERSTEGLSELRSEDNDVCEQFNILLDSVTQMLTDNQNSAKIVVQLIFISRYIERIADRAVNIADRVIFMLTYKYPGV